MAHKRRVGILQFRERLFDIIAKSFVSEGYEIEWLDLAKIGWPECRKKLDSGGFEFLISGNFMAFHDPEYGEELDAYLTQKNLPCVVWHWEKVFFSGEGKLLKRLHSKKLGKNFLFLVTDKSDIEALKRYDIEARYLPLAVDTELKLFQPNQELSSPFRYQVCFAGTPFRLEGLQNSSEDGLLRAFVVNNLLEFYTRANLNVPPPSQNAEMLQALLKIYELPDRNYQSLEKALDQLEVDWTRQLQPSSLKVFRESYRPRISYIYSYYQLVHILNRLRKFDIRIHGSEDWKYFLRDYPYETPGLNDANFYNMLSFSQISFCLTKLQFDNFLHERPMMALACGGFPITDFRPVIEEMFENDEIVTYRSFEEAEDSIRFYLENESARKAIAEKGRERVLRSHLYSHRIHEMDAHVKKYFGKS